jgi:hypothetical protein
MMIFCTQSSFRPGRSLREINKGWKYLGWFIFVASTSQEHYGLIELWSTSKNMDEERAA